MPETDNEELDTSDDTFSDDTASDDTDSEEDMVNKAVKEAKQPQKTLKDQLGEALSKKFPNDETALKAVKDTFSYVGKLKNLTDLDGAMGQLQKILNTDQKGVISRIEEITKTGGQVDSNRFVPREEFDRTNFYSQNPAYKPYSKLVENWAKANPDKSREEIVESDDFKEVFEKVKLQDEAANAKSVLKSNPKLGGITDKISESRQHLKEGKIEEAEKKAIGAVLDAYPLEG